MAQDLDSWIGKASAAPLPVLRQSVQALRSLTTRANYRGADLTQSLAHDPLICAQLLRLANGRSPDGRVATLEQAALMAGEGQLRALAGRLRAVEERLPAVELRPLQQLQRFAFHVGYLARSFTQQNRDHHYDDAFFAGLLHNLGEQVVRVVAPGQIAAIARVAAREGISRNAAAEQTLGFDFHDLSRALAQAWHLPALLQAALDERHFQDKRTELVDLAAGVVHGGAELLAPDAQDPLLQRVGDIIGVRGAELRSNIFRANTEAARLLADRLPTSARVVEIFPSEPLDTFEGEKPAAARAKPETLSRVAAVFESQASDSLVPQQAIELFIQALREGLGLDRVLFALLSPDRAMLQGRYYCGVETNAALHHFEFERNGRSLFARLMDKPVAVWVRPDNRDRLAPLLTAHVQRVVEVEEFLAHSIFAGERPVGLCYADRGLERRAIAAEEFSAFQRYCGLLAERLATLLRPPE